MRFFQSGQYLNSAFSIITYNNRKIICEPNVMAGLCPTYSWQELAYHKGAVTLPELCGT